MSSQWLHTKPCTCYINGEAVLCFKKDKNSPCMEKVKKP
jgi:hypothetical protein